MRQVTTVDSWVVYETPVRAKMGTMQAVCEQGEWDGLKRENPGFRLVKSGIDNEGEAERTARDGTASLLTGPRRYR